MPLNKGFDRVKRYLGIPDSPTFVQIRESRTRQQAIVPPAFLRRNRPKPLVPSATLQSNGLISRSASPNPTPLLPILPTVRIFVLQITKEQLSNFLIWYFYFNLVELSISPTEWHNYLPTMDMRRCVVLGDFLRSNKFPSLGNLDSVCTALGVSKPFVRFRIIRVSEARQVKFNEAVGAFRSIGSKAIKEEKILEIVQEWFMVGKQTVELLELSKWEIFEEWQHEILTRATPFLQLVVNPRLFMLQRRMGLQTEASEDTYSE